MTSRSLQRIFSDFTDIQKQFDQTSVAASLLPLLLCGLVLLISGATALAQTPAGSPAPPPGTGSQASNPCAAPVNQTDCLLEKIKPFRRIYDKLTPKQGLKLVHGNVVPGSGFTGGVGYTRNKPSESWPLKFDFSARASARKYWSLDSNLRLIRSVNSFDGLDSSLKLNIYGVIKDMPRLDFFGIGPETREQDRAVFHYREAAVGVDVAKPVRQWLDVGGAVEGIWPHITRIANPTVRSVERVYTEANTPGITSQPAFLHLAAFAGLHSKGQPESAALNYRFFYHAYQDLQLQGFSFRRFEADLKNKFAFGNNEVRLRGRLSFAETRVGQRVPFYLMQTLGGANLNGDDTLRGFRDYRFRDRDFALIQAEYLRKLYGPIDVIAFYDTGKVAQSVSQFDAGRMRHTYGLGIVVVPRKKQDYLFRFYVAFGSGEGSHTFFGLGDYFKGRDRLLR